jgi:hypothetical protein
MSETGRTDSGRGRRLRILLWAGAAVLVLSAAYYQRRTGPSYPHRGEIEVGGRRVAYRLARTGSTSADARIAVPLPGPEFTGRLLYRRFPTDDPLTQIPLTAEGDELSAFLPAQPAAGKLEYHLAIAGPDGVLRLPEADSVVIRFKSDVPVWALAPHLTLMFLSMLIGLRAGLAALFSPRETRSLAWIALAGLTVGGMMLGPVVQKFAFGAFWTGFPHGKDLTDNKMLVMWLVWLVACLIAGRKPGRRDLAGRWAVAAATVVMIGVFLIPHSLRGSQLDYEQLDRGVPAEEAIKTG